MVFFSYRIWCRQRGPAPSIHPISVHSDGFSYLRLWTVRFGCASRVQERSRFSHLCLYCKPVSGWTPCWMRLAAVAQRRGHPMLQQTRKICSKSDTEGKEHGNFPVPGKDASRGCDTGSVYRAIARCWRCEKNVRETWGLPVYVRICMTSSVKCLLCLSMISWGGPRMTLILFTSRSMVNVWRPRHLDGLMWESLCRGSGWSAYLGGKVTPLRSLTFSYTIYAQNAVYKTISKIVGIMKAASNMQQGHPNSGFLHHRIRSHENMLIRFKTSLLSKKLWRIQALRVEDCMIKVTYTSLYQLKKDLFCVKHRSSDEILVIEFDNLANSHASFTISGAEPHHVDDEGDGQGSKNGA